MAGELGLVSDGDMKAEGAQMGIEIHKEVLAASFGGCL